MILVVNIILNIYPMILASVLPDAAVFQQPSIYIPKYTITNNQLKINSLISENGQHQMFSLDFSITYSTTIVNFLPLILNHFCIGDNKIILEKFYGKKYIEEVYNEDLYKPVIIPIPVYKRSIFGFHFNIRNLFLDEKYDILKTGCIYISIYRNLYFGLKPTETLLRKTINDFKKLLQIMDDGVDRFAFRFSVETNRSNLLNRNAPMQPIYTNLFTFIFSSNGLGLKLIEVDPDNYHMLESNAFTKRIIRSLCTVS